MVVSAGASGGNIGQVAEDLLMRINADMDDRKSYTADNVTFHYIVSSKMIFLCVADEQFPVTQAYHYLQTLQNEWTRYYGSRGLSVAPSTANAEFGRKMATLMQPASGSAAASSSSSNFGRSSPAVGSGDKVEMVSRQIEDVKKQMVQNLDTVLARGEGIEALVQSTSSLNTNAAQFKKTAVQLKRHMWWKNAKCWIILGVVLLVIAFAIALIICKGNFKTCGGSNKPKSPSPAPHAPEPPTQPPTAPPSLPPTAPIPTAPPTTPPTTPPSTPPSAPPSIVVVPVSEPHHVEEPHEAPHHVEVPHEAPHHVEAPHHIEEPHHTVPPPEEPHQPHMEPHHVEPSHQPSVVVTPSTAPSTVAPSMPVPEAHAPSTAAPSISAPSESPSHIPEHQPIYHVTSPEKVLSPDHL